MEINKVVPFCYSSPQAIKEKMLNQEEVYKWLSDGDYGKLVDLLHRQKELIKSDHLLNHAATVSVSEILRVSKEVISPSDEFKYNLERLNQIHVGKFFQMTEAQHKDLISTLIRFSNGEINKAYQYAKYYPDEDFSQTIINEIEKSQPKEIEHTQDGYIKLTHNKQIEEVDYRISLFKSKEEQKMFLAFKRIFDTYQIYPNVALSSIIDFHKISEKLSSQEQKFFFLSTVDLVVFEPFKQYHPIYFFELDSIWHDEGNAIEKDKMKDKIFSISGLKLFRIRDRQNLKINEEEFEELVKEVRMLIENKG